MSIPLQSALRAALCTAAIGFAVAAVDAHAKTQSHVQNATGVCQSALPLFDGQIRKRPLALQNEGTASAFVSCSLMGTDRSVAGVFEIDTIVTNNTGGPIDLNCALVTGLSKFGAPQFYPKTVTVGANSIMLIFWTAAQDNGGLPFNNFTVNVSCSLPVGAGLSGTFVYFDEDIGV